MNDEWTEREKAMPAVAKVAGDAVARHERIHHQALTEVERYAKKLTLSESEDLRMAGADILDIIAMFEA